MRGRLIRPALVEIEQLDTAETAADPGVMGLNSGYDTEFGEPATQQTAGVTASLRKNKTDNLMLHAQVEVNKYNSQNAASVGHDQQALVTLVFHFSELEELGLINDDGEPTIRAGDRLVAMYRLDGSLMMRYNKPYLYVKQPRPYGPGVGGDRNLLIVDFATRDVGQQS